MGILLLSINYKTPVRRDYIHKMWSSRDSGYESAESDSEDPPQLQVADDPEDRDSHTDYAIVSLIICILMLIIWIIALYIFKFFVTKIHNNIYV